MENPNARGHKHEEEEKEPGLGALVRKIRLKALTENLPKHEQE